MPRVGRSAWLGDRVDNDNSMFLTSLSENIADMPRKLQQIITDPIDVLEMDPVGRLELVYVVTDDAVA